MIYEAKFITF